MNRNFFCLPEDEERRRALAKVYALLIKLADKKEKSAKLSETDDSIEKSVPLKSHIPPSEV